MMSMESQVISDGSRTTRRQPIPVLGWDIGGVNTKLVRVDDADPRRGRAASTAYEIQHDPASLAPTLAALATTVGARPNWPHAVTMTAELSQAFRTKREGVAYVLDAMAEAFPGDPVRVYTVDDRFLTPEEARARPIEVAAANWAATAAVVALTTPDAILIDIGTTSTDIIPVRHGRVAARGRTDPARLSTGELVYTGAVRTPVEAVLRHVPLGDGEAAVSAEWFATTGDAHVWLGQLDPVDYTSPTPDGRPTTRPFAGERLARVVCGDREMLDDLAIDRIARAIVEAQLEQVVAGIRRVAAAFPDLTVAVVTGLGEFVAAEAAQRAGLEVRSLGDRLGPAARTAPAAAVAFLLAQRLESGEV
jgi:(4-(4-[2-(gamma-L-glutamylamino)ethyl]phenoxymethyl)furan-2-yl)methanamine synthase